MLVAPNRGAPRPPGWFAKPGLRARVAEGEERARLWGVLTRAMRWLERTRRRAGRELPVVVLGSPK